MLMAATLIALLGIELLCKAYEARGLTMTLIALAFSVLCMIPSWIALFRYGLFSIVSAAIKMEFDPIIWILIAVMVVALTWPLTAIYIVIRTIHSPVLYR
jgi:hypothetical protein